MHGRPVKTRPGPPWRAHEYAALRFATTLTGERCTYILPLTQPHFGQGHSMSLRHESLEKIICCCTSSSSGSEACRPQTRSFLSKYIQYVFAAGYLVGTVMSCETKTVCLPDISDVLLVNLQMALRYENNSAQEAALCRVFLRYPNQQLHV
jgi:hypothetical protein